MFFNKKENIKYKLLTRDELIISLDRLSRFKSPDESYNRVFNLILYKCLITPKLSKKDLETLPKESVSKYVQIIWNESVKNIFNTTINNNEVNKALKFLSTNTFYIDEQTKILINTNLIISPILNELDDTSVATNLKYLIFSNKIFNNDNKFDKKAVDNFRKKYKTQFPLKKLLIVEGITEETLIPVFAEKLNKSIDKEGLYILGAGGKSKSPSLYMQLKEKLKIPVVILFDADAKEICEILNKNLLKKDKTILIEQGEFEDILSQNLIKRTINNEYDTASPMIISDLNKYDKMCSNIEYFYRTRKLGEFKKSKFSKLISENIKYNTDITDEIQKLINQIT